MIGRGFRLFRIAVVLARYRMDTRTASFCTEISGHDDLWISGRGDQVRRRRHAGEPPPSRRPPDPRKQFL